MRLNYIFNFSFVVNENETYFTYSLYNPSIMSRCIIDVSGQIKQSTWLHTTKEWKQFWAVPREQCLVYAYCGSFAACNQNSLPFCTCLDGFKPRSEEDWAWNDFSGGCVRRKNLQCGNISTSNGEKDKFMMKSDMILPEQSESVTVPSAVECESACLSKCSCNAYAYDNDRCSLWHGELVNLQQVSSGDSRRREFYIRLDASKISSAKSNNGIVIGAVVGSTAVELVILGIVLLFVWRCERERERNLEAMKGTLVAFTYRDLQIATEKFSEKLGGGGFGSVFKGKLPDSSEIAVKKLEGIGQGEKQFRAEVSTIGTIQHVNLVKLRGLCSDGNKKLLVYDFMKNGSLDTHLFQDSSKVLDWETRYQIALGTARGSVYLHEKCRDRIIHCDIKPENILLDAEFCPKVADFGLAKLVGSEFSRVLTTMRGTKGYLAPEWISGVAITAKADVYSYGMMLFEFVSGRRNSENSEAGNFSFFPTWAASMSVGEGDILSLLDPKLDRVVNVEEVTRLCRVACWCIQEDEDDRPTMSQVVQILEGVLDVITPPIPRSLQVFANNQGQIVFFTESSSNQSSQAHNKASSASSHSKGTAPSITSQS